MREYLQSVLMPRLREPLCRFVLLGLAILFVDRVISRADFMTGAQPVQIVVTASQQAALAEAFHSEHGRAPRADELKVRLDHWVDEQVLYREALALGLDRRDAIVQRQLTQKMRFLIEDATVLPEPAVEELQAWLDRYPERYGKARTLSFQQVFLSRGRHGTGIQREATRIAGLLEASPEDYVGLGDAFLVGQMVSDADEVRLRKEFGSDFAKTLEGLPNATWVGPVASPFGLHLVRINGRGSFQRAQLADVIERVRVDYQLDQRARQNRQALDQLRARYRIEFERSDVVEKAG